MTDEVAEQVLRDNYEQNVLLGNARAQQHAMLGVHERLIQFLEAEGDLDRSLEFLPSDAAIARRQKDGLGLDVTGVLGARRLREALPQEPAHHHVAARRPVVRSRHWPSTSRSRCAASTPPRSRRTRCVARSSPTPWRTRWSTVAASPSPTGPARRRARRPEQVARAYVVCREVFDLAGFVRRVEATDNVVSTAAQTALYLEFRRLIDRSVRWFLTSRPAALDIAAEVARFRPGIEAFSGRIGELLQGSERTRLQRRARELEGKGVPEELVARGGVPARPLLAARLHRDRGGHGGEARRRRRRLLPDLRDVLDRRDADAGHDAAPRRPVGRHGPRRAARRPLRGAREPDALGARRQQRTPRRRDPPRRVVRPQRRRARSGEGGARGDRADEPCRHRRALGRPAHAAHRDEAGGLRPGVPGRGGIGNR